MKKEIVGILVCTLMIGATVIPVSGDINLEYSIEKQSSMKNLNAVVEKTSDRSWNDWITATQETSSGDYISFGTTESYSMGSRDAWLIKSNSDGIELWNTSWGRVQCDGTLSGQETLDGGYIQVGWGRWPPSWDTDVWLIKTFANGAEDWNKRFGLSGVNDVGYFVCQTSDGGYVIAAGTRSYGAGSADAWLIKTDSNGDEDWNKTYGGVGHDRAWSVQQTTDGGYILTGHTGSYGGSDYDAWLIKTDSNGDEEWNKTYGGIAYDVGHDVRQTDDGYVIIGVTNSYGDMDYDLWLIKTYSNGNHNWNKTWPGSDSGYADAFGISGGMCIQILTDGYIMTGITDAYSAGCTDAFLIKTDVDGNEDWNVTFGGINYDEGYWIDLTSDNGYIIGGSTNTYGTVTWDGWLIKTDSNGDEEWNSTFGGAAPGNNPPNNPSPPDGPEEGITGVNYTFTTNTEDPDGDDVYYLFDWDDGSDSGWVGPYSSGSTGNASHAWDEEGDYKIKAKAKDEHGLESDWSYTSTIHIVQENRPPNKPDVNGPSSGKPDIAYNYTFNSIDPNGDDIFYYILWGDGYDDETSYVPSGTDVTLSHSWDKEGKYILKVKAKDIFGLESEEAEFEVNIPRTRATINLWYQWFLERFPLLEKLLNLIR